VKSAKIVTKSAQAAPRLPLAQTLASGLTSLFEARLVSPNLFSTFKPLTLMPVNFSRLKPLLHENTGKAIRHFPPNFSAIPQNFCPACLSKIHHAFGQRRQAPNLKK
jgi:hypothetical protein